MGRAFRKLLVALVALAVAAAGIGAVTPREARAASKPTVEVTRASTGKLTMRKGASYKLGSKASKGAKLAYKSSKPSVVSVSKKGALKARGTGSATITVTAKSGKSKAAKKVKVTVVAASKFKKVKAIKVTPAKRTLEVGGSVQLKATLTPKKASNKNLMYKSSNAKVATVSAKGKVVARAAGTAKVTVTSADNAKAKKVVTITVAKAPAPAQVAVASVSAKASREVLTVGESAQVTATVSPANAANRAVYYASSDPSVLAVDGGGRVSAKSPGTATVTAASRANPSAKATARIVVKARVSDPAPVADAPGIKDAGYAEQATTVDLARADVSDDKASATVDAGVLGQEPAAGQVVVIADENLQGTAIKVESTSRNADGSVSIRGSQPAFEEVFDELSVERAQGFTRDSITWMEEGVELEGVEDASLSTQSDELSTQADGTLGGQTFKFKLSKKFFDGKGLGDLVSGTGSVDFQVSVTPKVDWALDFDGLAMTRLKVMPNLKAQISGAIAAGVTLKVPIVTFDAAGTGVTLYFKVGIDGKFSLAYEVEVAAGIDWARGKDGFFSSRASAGGTHELSATGKLGLDAQAKVGLLCFEIGSFDVEAGGAASGTLTTRSTGMLCSDVDAWVYAETSLSLADWIAKLVGIDAKTTKEIWNKSTSPIKTDTAHFENFQRVSECTWDDGNAPGGGTDPSNPGGGTDPSNPGGGTDPSNPGGGTDPSNPGSVPDLSGVTRKTSLDQYSWGELKAIANAISAAGSDADGLAIAKQYDLVGSDGKLTGETKPVEVEGLGTADVRIAGFRHDDKTSGEKAGITFEFANTVGSYVMNTTCTNSGGWASSEMRNYLNSEYLPLLPASLTNNIAAVYKRTNNVGYITNVNDTTCVSTTDDKLWLLSMSEVYGELSSYSSNVPWPPATYDAEGTQYQLYADQGVTTSSYSHAKKTGPDSWWWLRSPDAHDSSRFHGVNGNGCWSYYYASYAGGVSPGFCF